MKRFLPALFILFCVLPAAAQVVGGEAADYSLDSLVFSTKKNAVEILPAPGASAAIPVTALKKIPSVMGTADPLRIVSFMPSVQTGNELDSGLHICGTENSHNVISMNGVPVYGAGHMLGLASVFNSSHFSRMTYSSVASWENRLGGAVDMELPQTMPSKVGLEASAGLFLTSASVRLPVGSSSSLAVSGRHSYFNLLYKDFLEYNDAPFTYDFGDANLTWDWTPGLRDKITVNAYFGRDEAGYDTRRYRITADARWNNALASADWRHEGGDWTLGQKIYWSSYRLRDRIGVEIADFSIPTDMMTAGYKASFSLGSIEAAAQTAYHRTSPLLPADAGHIVQDAWETALQGGYTFRKGPWMAGLSVRGTWFLTPENRSLWSADPKAEAAFRTRNTGTIGLKAGLSHQYLIQTGPTNMGFPCEYWLFAGEQTGPQSSKYVNLSWTSPEFAGKWRISAEAYFRSLGGQLDYIGALTDYTSSSFSLDDHLLKEKGRNFGFNVAAQKTSGRLTGWISYAFNRSLRSSDNPDYPKWYPSSHERLHEVNFVGSWDFGKWDAGISFIAAAGRPFTDAESFYITGSKVIALFGEYNAARLKPYIRGDVSVNWYFAKTDRLRHGLNLSVYNATALPSELSRILQVDDDGKFVYDSINFTLTVMPCVAYFIKF